MIKNKKKKISNQEALLCMNNFRTIIESPEWFVNIILNQVQSATKLLHMQEIGAFVMIRCRHENDKRVKVSRITIFDGYKCYSLILSEICYLCLWFYRYQQNISAFNAFHGTFHRVSDPDANFWHIGASDADNEGYWRWLNGAAVSDIRVTTTDQLELDQLDCSALNRKNTAIQMVMCETTRRRICEWPNLIWSFLYAYKEARVL